MTVVVIGLLSLVIAAIFLLVRRRLRNLQELPFAMQFLIQHGKNDSYVCFQDVETGHFLQFVKYISPERSGIELDFPCSNQNERFFHPILTYLDDRKIKYSILDAGNDRNFKILRADFGTGIAELNEFSKYTFHKLMGVSPNAKFKYKHGGKFDLDLKQLTPR